MVLRKSVRDAPRAIREVAIHHRDTLETDGRIIRKTFLRCVRRQDWWPLRACSACESYLGIASPSIEGHAVVRCYEAEHGEIGCAGPRASVREVLEPAVLCVRPEVPTKLLAAHLARAVADVVVVVDGDGHPVGTVSPARVTTESDEPVSRLMSPVVVALLEVATVEDARRALLADDRFRALPVVSSGKVLGVVSLERVLQWLHR